MRGTEAIEAAVTTTSIAEMARTRIVALVLKRRWLKNRTPIPKTTAIHALRVPDTISPSRERATRRSAPIHTSLLDRAEALPAPASSQRAKMTTGTMIAPK